MRQVVGEAAPPVRSQTAPFRRSPRVLPVRDQPLVDRKRLSLSDLNLVERLVGGIEEIVIAVGHGDGGDPENRRFTAGDPPITDTLRLGGRGMRSHPSGKSSSSK
jgi:hypothetical protein